MWRFWFAGIIVAAAVATMIALGLWQLQRSSENSARMEYYETNQLLAPVALASVRSDDPRNLFRTVTAPCFQPSGWQVDSGRSVADAATDNAGWRHIVTCAAQSDQPIFLVVIGVSDDPLARPSWTGGVVTGTLITEPQRSGLLGRLFRSAPSLRPMVVARDAAPGLLPSLQPDPSSLPDNHIAYAVQWFIFAFAAALIFLLALRGRLRRRVLA